MRQAALRAKSGRIDDAIKMVDAAAPQDEEERTLGVLTKAQILRDADRVGRRLGAGSGRPSAARYRRDQVRIGHAVRTPGPHGRPRAHAAPVIALDPEHAHAYNALGYTLADHNQRLPEALDLITQALELSPNDPFILDSMGWVKFRMGDQIAAADYLRRAYSVRPEADIAAHRRSALDPGQTRPCGRVVARRGAEGSQEQDRA